MSERPITPVPAHGAGPTIGIVIIVLLLALGAFYFWFAHFQRVAAPLPYILNDVSTSSAQ